MDYFGVADLARHLAVSSLSARALMKTPPTTERAWKPICLPVCGVVPVGEGDAGGGLVGPAIDGVDEGVELRWVFGQGGGPELPVELGVGLAAVEREAVAVDLGW